MTEGKPTADFSISPGGTNSPASTVSAEDQAFIDSYKSAADEYDEAARETPVRPVPAGPTSTLSPEDEAFVNSYQSYADEIDSQVTREGPGKPPQPAAKQEETLESLRAQLVQQKAQQARAEAKPAYIMPGPGGTAVRRETADGNAALIKATQDKIFQLEKEERRNAYMELQRSIGREQEAEVSQDPGEG